MPRERSRQINNEIATIKNNHLHYAYGGEHRIQPKDGVLIDRGSTKGFEALRDVMRDPHTFAVLQKRWGSVVEREFEVVPASDKRIDKKAAELVERQLKAIGSFDEELDEGELVPNIYGGFDQVCYNLLKAEFYGFQPAEIIYGTNGTEIYPKQIKDKSPGRFVYLAGDKGYRFRLLTQENPWNGVKLPPKKFIIHTFHPEDDNPYGWGMGGRLFYPVMFKRKLAEFALVYADKFGSPTGKATYPDGREDLRDVLIEAMNNMAQESGIVLPDGCNFEWMAIAQGGGDVYTNLMDYFDREISKTVLGETGSTDQQSSGGSRARDQVGNEVRIEITKQSADFLSATLNNTLLKWLTWYNFGDQAQPPTIWRKFPELEEKEDLNGRSQRDSTISTMMELKPTRKYIEETYSIELEEKTEEEQQQGGLNDELSGIFDQSNKEQVQSAFGYEASYGSRFGKESSFPKADPPKRDVTSNEQEDTSLELSEPFNFASAKQILKWNGLEIGVENLPGDRRHDKVLKSGYGHIRGTKGADGMALDVYFHPSAFGWEASRPKRDGQDVPNPDIKTSDKLFKITQLDQNGNFDEHKYMAGYASKTAAKQAYLAQMPKTFFGGIKKVAIADLTLNSKLDATRTSHALEETSKDVSSLGANPLGQTPNSDDIFASVRRATADIDQSIEAVLPEIDQWRSLINNEIQRVNSLSLDDAAKFNELESSLYKLYDQMDGDKYGEILSEAIAAAEFAGRYDAFLSSK